MLHEISLKRQNCTTLYSAKVYLQFGVYSMLHKILLQRQYCTTLLKSIVKDSLRRNSTEALKKHMFSHRQKRDISVPERMLYRLEYTEKSCMTLNCLCMKSILVIAVLIQHNRFNPFFGQSISFPLNFTCRILNSGIP